MVFGFSVFMQQDLEKSDLDYFQKMRDAGFSGVFTSMHIPEDDPSKYANRLRELAGAARDIGLGLMVDISGDALARAGFSFDRLGDLLELGVTGLRMDYHVSLQEIARATQALQVSLNASTVTREEIAELRALGAQFDHLEAWHNYYPRPETGLGKRLFRQKTEFLVECGLRVVAFAPGDANLRPPLKLGLPTLEKHRDGNPLAAALELLDLGAAGVYVGDGGLRPGTIDQFARYLRADTLLLRTKPNGSHYQEWVFREHRNRSDAARDTIRSADARFWNLPHIAPEFTHRRPRGTVTVDNSRYGRYMGDIQIALRSLPADRRVNVVGRVRREDRALLPFIGPNQKYQIEAG